MKCQDCHNEIIEIKWIAINYATNKLAMDITDFDCPNCGSFTRGYFSGVYDPQYLIENNFVAEF